ncbi:hypothetical protein PCASD_25700 [Puccinia coronata f. sp. avenae]|uniref:R3H-associated N-terminal domain-containing protein n=1 Tax=Puccinia coronata f. sp. avenae TaxID=200324 RepID=A0A2N5RVL8_9BASI|nr:hypothetical protein PCASD_25700 [Puccinia coronata f. sp. avenae]
MDETETIHAKAAPKPLPLSFPSILVNPKLKHISSQLPRNSRPKKTDPAGAETRPIGRRRQQRVSNAQFSANPHVTRPTTRDYQLWTADAEMKFRTPPPRGYPSSLYIPPAEPIPIDAFSATMGAFNRSLKGVRKNIRRLVGPPPPAGSGPGPVEQILLKIDARLSDWVDSHVVWKATETDFSRTVVDPNPWPCAGPVRHQPVPEPSSDPCIVEISRSPHMLNWEVANPFGRYLVHCVARYYGIVSFSRPAASPDSDPTQTAGSRSTVVCMVKAHFPTRRGSRIDGHQSLDTPPTTDLDSELSAVEVLSEDSGALTDDEPPLRNPAAHSPLCASPLGAHIAQTSTPTRAAILQPKPSFKVSAHVDSDAADHSSLDSSGGDNDDDDDDDCELTSPRDPSQVDWTSHVEQDPNQTITAHSVSAHIPLNTPHHVDTSDDDSLHLPLPKILSPLKPPQKASTDHPRLSFLEWVRS